MMGREIRKVPAGWEHPKYGVDDVLGKPLFRNRVGSYKPLCDQSFNEAMREWVDEWEAWQRGERPEWFNADKYGHMEFHEYHGHPPDPDYYRPEWAEEERTHFQFYETVSEGTPLSPPMPSLEALADWLTENEDFWGHGPRTREQAEAFCRTGWAPSMVFGPRGAKMNLEALEDMQRHRAD